MATLKEIKTELGIENLELNKSINQDGVVSDWYRMWDNTNRVQISIHKDTVALIQKEPTVSNLGLQSEDKISPSSQQPYTNKRIVAYTEAEITL